MSVLESLLHPGVAVAGRFRLERELGRGGMGAVWLAEHAELHVPCALKFILMGDQGQARARFDREAKAAAQLRSPHVVQILDYGTWEGLPFLAMEFLEGEDLRHRLDRVHRLPPQEVVSLFEQAARGLSKAHQAGIVHRDLKPDNLFLVRDDGRDFVKILDFGIAKVASTEGQAGVATQTGMMLGTPYYMSPEQAQGNKQIDHRSDLFSLAVIIYESLVGARPFESDALGDLLMRIIVQPLPVPSQAAPWLGAGFDAWWAKAAARAPEQRFQSVQELIAGLSEALGTGTATGDRTSRVAPPPGATFVSPEGALARTNTALSRTGEQPKSKAPLLAIAGAALVLAAGVAGLFAMKQKKDSGGSPVPATAAATPDAASTKAAEPAASAAPTVAAAASSAPAPETKPAGHEPAKAAHAGPAAGGKDAPKDATPPKDVKPPAGAAPKGKADLGF